MIYNVVNCWYDGSTVEIEESYTVIEGSITYSRLLLIIVITGLIAMGLAASYAVGHEVGVNSCPIELRGAR